MAANDRLFDLDNPNPIDVFYTAENEELTFTPAEAAVLEAVALTTRAEVCYLTTPFIISFSGRPTGWHRQRRSRQHGQAGRMAQGGLKEQHPRDDFAQDRWFQSLAKSDEPQPRFPINEVISFQSYFVLSCYHRNDVFGENLNRLMKNLKRDMLFFWESETSEKLHFQKNDVIATLRFENLSVRKHTNVPKSAFGLESESRRGGIIRTRISIAVWVLDIWINLD